MKRMIALLCAVLLLCSLTVTVFAEGETAETTETTASTGPVMLPGMTPALAVVAGMAITVSIFGWWSNRNNKDRRL